MNGGKIPLIDPELLTEILSSASDIALLVSRDLRIMSVLVNPNHRSFGQLADWEGEPLSAVLTEESLRKFLKRLAEMRDSRRGPLAVEINHADQTNWEFPVRYSLHEIKADGSLLLLGRDLRPIAEVQQQLVAAQMTLERDYETQREMDTRYRVLMEVTRDPIVLISMSSGRIADVNLAAAALLGGQRPDLVGAAIAQEFEGRRRGEFLESMANLAVADSQEPIELTARRSQKRLMITPTVFRAAGERILLCQLDEADAITSSADELGENLSRLYHQGVDGVVFADAEGIIRAANEAFLNLTDSPNLAAIRGKSLADFLARGAVDLRVMLDNVKRTGQLRAYSTRLNTDYSGQIASEISATWIGDAPNQILALVIREASRIETPRRPSFNAADDGARNVMELVGSSTLRDIVAESTVVIEKMCIESALHLTRNYRVAAADMLSLSRQSLYVKLRKFGLINKDDE